MGVAARKLVLWLLLAAPALAQPESPFDVPFADRAPAIERGELRAAAVGIADERVHLASARRDAARGAARARAIAAIHRFADDALARARAAPACAAQAHHTIDTDARVIGSRPLVDGSAVVVVAVPLAALAAACNAPGVVWAR